MCSPTYSTNTWSIQYHPVTCGTLFVTNVAKLDPNSTCCCCPLDVTEFSTTWISSQIKIENVSSSRSHHVPIIATSVGLRFLLLKRAVVLVHMISVTAVEYSSFYESQRFSCPFSLHVCTSSKNKCSTVRTLSRITTITLCQATERTRATEPSIVRAK